MGQPDRRPPILGRGRDSLRDGWYEAAVRDTDLRLECGGADLVLREPTSGTARQRRFLHRAGFRRVADDPRRWCWTAPEPTPTEVVAPALPPRMRAAVEHAQRDLAIVRALAATAVHVLREVYRCTPEQVSLLVPEEEDGRYDDENDDWYDGASPGCG